MNSAVSDLYVRLTVDSLLAMGDRKSSRGALLGFIAGLLVMSAIGGTFLYVTGRTGTSSYPPTPASGTSDVQNQISALHSDIKGLRDQLDSISREASDSDPNLQLAAIKADLKSLDQRLTRIEQAVLDNPSKALELTILQHDIENLKANYKADLENTHIEINRVYDQNKWFLGLMATMALAVVSLVIGNFLRKPDKQAAQSEKAAADETEAKPKRAGKSIARRGAKARSGELRLVKKPPRVVGREFVEYKDDDLLN